MDMYKYKYVHIIYIYMDESYLGLLSKIWHTPVRSNCFLTMLPPKPDTCGSLHTRV